MEYLPRNGADLLLPGSEEHGGGPALRPGAPAGLFPVASREPPKTHLGERPRIVVKRGGPRISLGQVDQVCGAHLNLLLCHILLFKGLLTNKRWRKVRWINSKDCYLDND